MRLEACESQVGLSSSMPTESRTGRYAVHTPVALRRKTRASVAQSDVLVSGVRVREQRPPAARRTSPELHIAVPPSDPGHLPTPMLPPAPAPSGPTRATLMVLTGTEAGRMVVVGPEGLLIGREAREGLLVEEIGVSRRHARIAAGPDGGFYVEDLGSTNGTFVRDRRVSFAPLSPGDSIRLGQRLRLRFALTDEAEEALQRTLYESSVRDSLTHVFTRRYFTERLAEELSSFQEAQADSALLVVDLDGLKDLNDRYGHLAGDRALCAVAARIGAMMPPENVLARYGGDEFVVLAPGIGATQATLLARRLREAVAQLRFSAGGNDVPVTVSIGIAALSELSDGLSTATDLFALADDRLYAAKRSGRNCVRASVA